MTAPSRCSTGSGGLPTQQWRRRRRDRCPSPARPQRRDEPARLVETQGAGREAGAADNLMDGKPIAHAPCVAVDATSTSTVNFRSSFDPGKRHEWGRLLNGRNFPKARQSRQSAFGIATRTHL